MTPDERWQRGVNSVSPAQLHALRQYYAAICHPNLSYNLGFFSGALQENARHNRLALVKVREEKPNAGISLGGSVDDWPTYG